MAKTKKQKTKNTNLKRSVINMVILSTIICVLVYGIYTVIQLIINPTDTLILQSGMVSIEESTVGYVIREESIIKSENQTGKLEPIKSEGEKVAKGEAVFKYQGEDEENLSKQIEELNQEIQEALEGKVDLLPTDIKAIDNQVENKLKEIKNKNNTQEIKEYKKDINNYITKKAEIAGDLSPAGEYINTLLDKRTKLTNQLYEEAEYVNATKSGVISYRVDNLEETLTIDNMKDLTKDYLESLNLKTGQIITTSSEQGKIINNYECYIAVVSSSEEAQSAQVGDKVSLRLSTGEKVISTIENIKNENKSSLIIFKITKGVEQLIGYRKISIDIIWMEYEGLKVPKSAIIYENGLSYVMRNKNGNISKILVKIEKEDENYCIITNYQTSELKGLGLNATEISNIKKINMYDEIISNPDLSKTQ